MIAQLSPKLKAHRQMMADQRTRDLERHSAATSSLLMSRATLPQPGQVFTSAQYTEETLISIGEARVHNLMMAGMPD